MNLTAAIRRQVYHRHYITTVEISIGPPLSDEELLAIRRERCELHKGSFCDCTTEDFMARSLKIFVEAMSKPSYLPFVPNRG